MSRRRGSTLAVSFVIVLTALAFAAPVVGQDGKPIDDAGVKALEAEAQAKPADAPAATRLGAALLERARRTQDHRDYARAAAALKDALKRDPKHTPATVLLASCQLDRHLFTEAVELADQALAATPDAPDALAVRGDARLQLGDLVRAREDYEKLFTAKPDLLAHARMANLLFAEGDAQTARGEWEAALAAGDDAPEALRAWCLVRTGELHFRTGAWDEAGECYQKALALRPTDADVLDHLAELHAARGQFEQAVKFSDQAIAAGGRRPEFLRARGDLCAAMGDADEAFAWHEKALGGFLEAAAAGHVPAFRHLAAMYCDVEALANPPEALRWARRDVQVRRTVATLTALAWALHHDGRTGEAASTLDKALRARTADAAILYRAGLVYAQGKDPAKSRPYLRKAAAANPKFQEFHFFR